MRLALDAFAKPIGAFRATLAATADEVRNYLATRQSTWEGKVARVGAQLGPLASGRIDVERFATLVEDQPDASSAALETLGGALAALGDLAGRSERLCVVELVAGGSLYEAVGRGLAEIGRAFSAARLVSDVRAGRFAPATRGAAAEPLPFSRWTRAERRLAPPLVVRVEGRDLRAAGLAEFLDGRQRLALVVEGECPPAPLARLITPGIFVLQSNAGAGLDRLLAWDGPGIAALVPDSAARFAHDPGRGAAVWDRLGIESLPERVGRRGIGGFSAAQQMEELELLRSLASRPAGRGACTGGAAAPGPVVAAAEATPADPADKLAAWLLSRVDLSDVG
ncbi:MAG: hypothetical protein HYV93_14345 [Candidatus Rokubacteria bacterium]|nr:hypothetical protein [Candidatus Rokubacteria bacterium]